MHRRVSHSLAHCLAMMIAAATCGIAGPAQAKPYKGAELYSQTPVLYGRVEMRMRMIRGSGMLSTFFMYKDGSEKPGAQWEEIDIEVLGKGEAKTWQSNLITGSSKQTSEQLHPMTASLADDYHTYSLEWTPEAVVWSLDGREIRRTKGGQVAQLTSPESLRFNVWSSESVGWVGTLDDTLLPQVQFVNWVKYYRYNNGAFELDWTDDFDTLDTSRWATGNWTFDGNRVDFDPANAVVKDGTLVLALTREGQTGFSGTVPVDSGASAPIALDPSAATSTWSPVGNTSNSSCALSNAGNTGRHFGVTLLGLCLLALRKRRTAGRPPS